MDFSIYLNKRVHLTLNKGYTYIGLVIACDDDSITLIDKNNSKVCLKKDSVDFIKELL